MKTYPILRTDRSLHGFEIDNAWISFERLGDILCSVDGVSDVRRVDFSDDRMEFLLNGELCVVHEPFGDNSRYWIGPRDAANSTLDISPVHNAILAYNSPAIKILKFLSNWCRSK